MLFCDGYLAIGDGIEPSCINRFLVVWDGPFKVVATSPHGAIMLESDEGNIFKVNGQCLRHYYEPNMQGLKVLDIIEFITF